VPSASAHRERQIGKPDAAAFSIIKFRTPRAGLPRTPGDRGLVSVHAGDRLSVYSETPLSGRAEGRADLRRLGAERQRAATPHRP